MNGTKLTKLDGTLNIYETGNVVSFEKKPGQYSEWALLLRDADGSTIWFETFKNRNQAVQTAKHQFPGYRRNFRKPEQFPPQSRA